MYPGVSKTPAHHYWAIQEIQDLVQHLFNKRPCWFQIKVALALHAGKDVVACASTGAGKTLSFWIPLLMTLEEGKDKITFVVTPLNLLGKQNVDKLTKVGLSAIAVSSENNNVKSFRVRNLYNHIAYLPSESLTIYFQDIEEGKYRIVTINPEILMNNPNVDKLWKKPQFMKKILNFIFDEEHCISQWGAFLKEYLQIGALRYLIPESIPFYIPSATLPPTVTRKSNAHVIFFHCTCSC